MTISELINSLNWLRNDIIGRNMMFETPFGLRPLVYADYTASGRGLHSIEGHISHILQFYANSHTEDSFTGKTMTSLLHEAEHIIKQAVNAGPKGKIIFTESGTTGGITKLQQILGVYWPPATRERVNLFLKSCLDRNPDRVACNLALQNYIHDNKPIVFVSPYEHHSNELMWRLTLCEVVEIPFAGDAGLDLGELEKVVSDPKYAHRPKIGSFSAASNVTGLKTHVYEVARILHKHGALACFDFAACAPYIDIDMNRDSESYFDAIFFSPHKFLGGPGSSGVLIFNADIYQEKLPPTVAAGGTVDYVSPEKQEFIKDIESREKPGTPGILQAIRVALAISVKDKVGTQTIDEIENHFYQQFMDAFTGDERIVFYGPQEISRKVPIIPFNIKHKDRFLHPKFVTRLLSDLFGIQSRAGCSCAGPYGHHLMNIDQKHSDFYRCIITNIGYSGIKPGWVRVNLHYALDPDELDYLIKAMKFVCEHGYKFLQLYVFNIKNGEWGHKDYAYPQKVSLNIESVYSQTKPLLQNPDNHNELYQQALDFADTLANSLTADFSFMTFEQELETLT
jgi:selenocysteine lyase/cysteine desulfurase